MRCLESQMLEPEEFAKKRNTSDVVNDNAIRHLNIIITEVIVTITTKYVVAETYPQDE